MLDHKLTSKLNRRSGIAAIAGLMGLGIDAVAAKKKKKRCTQWPGNACKKTWQCCYQEDGYACGWNGVSQVCCAPPGSFCTSDLDCCGVYVCYQGHCG